MVPIPGRAGTQGLPLGWSLGSPGQNTVRRKAIFRIAFPQKGHTGGNCDRTEIRMSPSQTSESSKSTYMTSQRRVHPVQRCHGPGSCEHCLHPDQQNSASWGCAVNCLPGAEATEAEAMAVFPQPPSRNVPLLSSKRGRRRSCLASFIASLGPQHLSSCLLRAYPQKHQLTSPSGSAPSSRPFILSCTFHSVSIAARPWGCSSTTSFEFVPFFPCSQFRLEHPQTSGQSNLSTCQSPPSPSSPAA